jgi:two-component system sensor histidine kinase PilS (NtrC family)
MNSANERQPLFHLYSYFTLILALLFLGFYFLEDQLQWWQSTTPKLLPIVLSGYLALAISNVIRSHAHVYNKSDMLLPSLLAEILLLGLLLLFLAPKQQDISIFMLISVGLGNTILNKRLGYFIAAMATLMVLSASYINQSNKITDQLLSGSFISILFFIESFIIQALKTRLTEAQSHVVKTQNQLHSVARISDLIIERMLTGVCVVNNTGKILRINRAASERIGSALDPEKKHDKQSIPAQLFERLQYWHESQLQNDEAIELTLPNGSKQSIIVSFAEIDNVSTLVFVEDKSTVARRAQQFKLSSLARMAASIAHEIRNPLNAVSHASQLLKESEDLNKEDKRLCDIILNHSTRMEKIIQNVLQISKRNSTEAQWIKLQPWVNKFLNDFKLQHDVPIDLQGADLSIRFDPSQLHQVLWNLCSNAVRHGKVDKNNPISIKLGKLNQRPFLSIEDNGNGIPPKEINFLYEPFHTTSAQGTGLGLYLVKELCEANHAEIYYQDQKDKGACFEILFARDYASALEHKEIL